MPDDSTLTSKRPRSARASALLVVILVVVAGIVIRYRREIYVYAMIDCGGLNVIFMATPHVLMVHRELLDEELADADSEAMELEILKNNLQHRYEWVRTHALQYVEKHRERLAPLLASDLISLLEQDYGHRVKRSLMLLDEVPNISESEAQRLLTLARKGDPSWRRSYALILMRTHRSNFDETDLCQVGVDLAVKSSSFLVREDAVALLQSLNTPPTIDDVRRLIESDDKEPQMAGLRFLVTIDPESATKSANTLFRQGRPETKQLVLSILAELDVDSARELARQGIPSNDTSVSAAALLTLRKLGDSVPNHQETEIMRALEKEFMSGRLVGHQRMRRLRLLHELDAKRAIDLAREMVSTNQLETLPGNFLREIGETLPNEKRRVDTDEESHRSK